MSRQRFGPMHRENQVTGMQASWLSFSTGEWFPNEEICKSPGRNNFTVPLCGKCCYYLHREAILIQTILSHVPRPLILYSNSWKQSQIEKKHRRSIERVVCRSDKKIELRLGRRQKVWFICRNLSFYLGPSSYWFAIDRDAQHNNRCPSRFAFVDGDVTAGSHLWQNIGHLGYVLTCFCKDGPRDNSGSIMHCEDDGAYVRDHVSLTHQAHIL